MVKLIIYERAKKERKEKEIGAKNKNRNSSRYYRRHEANIYGHNSGAYIKQNNRSVGALKHNSKEGGYRNIDGVEHNSVRSSRKGYYGRGDRENDNKRLGSYRKYMGKVKRAKKGKYNFGNDQGDPYSSHTPERGDIEGYSGGVMNDVSEQSILNIWENRSSILDNKPKVLLNNIIVLTIINIYLIFMAYSGSLSIWSVLWVVLFNSAIFTLFFMSNGWLKSNISGLISNNNKRRKDVLANHGFKASDISINNPFSDNIWFFNDLHKRVLFNYKDHNLTGIFSFNIKKIPTNIEANVKGLLRDLYELGIPFTYQFYFKPKISDQAKKVEIEDLASYLSNKIMKNNVNPLRRKELTIPNNENDAHDYFMEVNFVFYNSIKVYYNIEGTIAGLEKNLNEIYQYVFTIFSQNYSHYKIELLEGNELISLIQSRFSIKTESILKKIGQFINEKGSNMLSISSFAGKDGYNFKAKGKNGENALKQRLSLRLNKSSKTYGGINGNGNGKGNGNGNGIGNSNSINNKTIINTGVNNNYIGANNPGNKSLGDTNIPKVQFIRSKDFMDMNAAYNRAFKLLDVKKLSPKTIVKIIYYIFLVFLLMIFSHYVLMANIDVTNIGGTAATTTTTATTTPTADLIHIIRVLNDLIVTIMVIFGFYYGSSDYIIKRSLIKSGLSKIMGRPSSEKTNINIELVNPFNNIIFLRHKLYPEFQFMFIKKFKIMLALKDIVLEYLMPYFQFNPTKFYRSITGHNEMFPVGLTIINQPYSPAEFMKYHYDDLNKTNQYLIREDKNWMDYRNGIFKSIQIYETFSFVKSNNIYSKDFDLLVKRVNSNILKITTTLNTSIKHRSLASSTTYYLSAFISSTVKAHTYFKRGTELPIIPLQTPNLASFMKLIGEAKRGISVQLPAEFIIPAGLDSDINFAYIYNTETSKRQEMAGLLKSNLIDGLAIVGESPGQIHLWTIAILERLIRNNLNSIIFDTDGTYSLILSVLTNSQDKDKVLILKIGENFAINPYISSPLTRDDETDYLEDLIKCFTIAYDLDNVKISALRFFLMEISNIQDPDPVSVSSEIDLINELYSRDNVSYLMEKLRNLHYGKNLFAFRSEENNIIDYHELIFGNKTIIIDFSDLNKSDKIFGELVLLSKINHILRRFSPVLNEGHRVNTMLSGPTMIKSVVKSGADPYHMNGPTNNFDFETQLEIDHDLKEQDMNMHLNEDLTYNAQKGNPYLKMIEYKYGNNEDDIEHLDKLVRDKYIARVESSLTLNGKTTKNLNKQDYMDNPSSAALNYSDHLYNGNVQSDFEFGTINQDLNKIIILEEPTEQLTRAYYNRQNKFELFKSLIKDIRYNNFGLVLKCTRLSNLDGRIIDLCQNILGLKTSDLKDRQRIYDLLHLDDFHNGEANSKRRQGSYQSQFIQKMPIHIGLLKRQDIDMPFPIEIDLKNIYLLGSISENLIKEHMKKLGFNPEKIEQDIIQNSNKTLLEKDFEEYISLIPEIVQFFRELLDIPDDFGLTRRKLLNILKKHIDHALLKKYIDPKIVREKRSQLLNTIITAQYLDRTFDSKIENSANSIELFKVNEKLKLAIIEYEKSLQNITANYEEVDEFGTYIGELNEPPNYNEPDILNDPPPNIHIPLNNTPEDLDNLDNEIYPDHQEQPAQFFPNNPDDFDNADYDLAENDAYNSNNDNTNGAIQRDFGTLSNLQLNDDELIDDHNNNDNEVDQLSSDENVLKSKNIWQNIRDYLED